jgi:cytochrome c oxidase subunit 5b
MSFLAAAARIAGPRIASRISSTSSSTSSRAVLSAASRRNFSSSIKVLASGPPVIQGEGGKVGEVASDEEQSTGLERFELLGRLQGLDVFDLKPLESDRKGTKKDPIVVASLVSIS